MQDRRGTNTTATSPTASGSSNPPPPHHHQQQQQDSTPEPSMVASSSSYSTDYGGYGHNHPASSRDTLSPPMSSSTSQHQTLPPPPPLEVFGYPHMPEYFPDCEEEEEDCDNEDCDQDISRRRSSGGDVVEYSPNNPSLDPALHPRGGGEPDPEFKHFASMAAVFQGSGAAGMHPSTGSGRMQQQQQAPTGYQQDCPLDVDSRYTDHHYERAHQSSRSSNSVGFSPPEYYRSTGNNGGSRDAYPMDCRHSHHPSTTSFQPVRNLPFWIILCYFNLILLN